MMTLRAAWARLIALLQRDAADRKWRGLPGLDGIVQDVRYAARALRRAPGFTLTAVATLAIGIGANAAVFTVTNAVLFKGLPFVDGNDRLLYIERPGAGHSYPDFENWRTQATAFEGLAAASAWLVSLSDNGFPERYEMTLMSANGFALIGQRPILGRDFAPADELPGAAPVAILSYRLWERRYAKDPDVIGRTVRVEVSGASVLQGSTATVIGVMAERMSFPFDSALWLPLVPAADRQGREARNITFLFGRVAEGVAIDSARAELETIGRRLASAQPVARGSAAATESTIAVQNSNEHFVGSRATLMFASMWVAVGVVLLIACGNLANLMLARAIGRAREVSVRVALGAGRWRIIRQLLIECLMLSAAGGLAGWWIATLGVRAFAVTGFAPFNYRHDVDLTMDYGVVGYLSTISIGTGLLFALLPASRLSRLDVNAALKDGGRGVTGGRRGQHLSTLLVVAEVALAVVLLAGAGVMLRSFLNIYAADVGAHTTDVLLAEMGLPVARYPSTETQIAFYGRLKIRLEAIPGVASVAIADRFPTQGARRLRYEIAGGPPQDEQRLPTLSTLVIGSDYFRTMGAMVRSGREFTDKDGASAVPVILVNERFARQQWPGEDPLGKRLRLFDGQTERPWRTVVGVVSNIVQQDATRQEFVPLAYLPYQQTPMAFMYLFARTSVPADTLGAALRSEVRALDPDLPFSFSTLATRLESNYRNSGLAGALFLILSAIALLLASLGLYTVMAHSVSRRTQELGIRMAMGATSGDIRALVLAHGALPLGIGLLVGLAAAVAVNRVLMSALVQVSPADPPTLVVTTVVLLVAAAGMTPMTVVGLSLTRTVWPMTAGVFP